MKMFPLMTASSRLKYSSSGKKIIRRRSLVAAWAGQVANDPSSFRIDEVEAIDVIEFLPFKAEGFFVFLVPDLPSPIVLAKNWTADHLKISRQNVS
jgi:hypothetical protein